MLMENQNSESAVLNYISQPDNKELNNFFLAVQRYHNQNGLEELFPILPLLLQLKNWIEYLNKPPVGLEIHSVIINEPLYLSNFNDFDRYVILDILSTFLDLIDFKDLNFLRKYSAIEQFTNKKNEISQKIKNFTLQEIKSLIDSVSGKSNRTQIQLLTTYKRLYFRVTKLDQNTISNFSHLVDLQISNLQQNPSTTNNNLLSEEIIKLTQLQQSPEYSDTEKLYVKDVAKILKCHESQVRRLISREVNPLIPYRDSDRGRLYFFYPEVKDWMKNNKQRSSLEEAGDVFRRRSNGANKKRRPRLE